MSLSVYNSSFNIVSLFLFIALLFYILLQINIKGKQHFRLYLWSEFCKLGGACSTHPYIHRAPNCPWRISQNLILTQKMDQWRLSHPCNKQEMLVDGIDTNSPNDSQAQAHMTCSSTYFQ